MLDMTTAAHSDLAAEQAYLDRAHNMLDRGHADAEASLAAHVPGNRATAQAMRRSLDILRNSKGTGALIFGRADTADDCMYIGRRRVYDQEKNLLVVSWHAPAAAVFYESAPADPHGLKLKRSFVEEDRKFVRILDEIVATTAAAAATGEMAPAFSDALLAELDRSRDGAMRDVIATIQAEQYRIIRSDDAGLMVVQGGPGTGKTVVGLHRAAWLAFNNEAIRRAGMLVVTPTSTLLSYIGGVLPILGVTDVMQAQLSSLYAGDARLAGVDDSISARTKSSAAMATLLRRALTLRISVPDDDLVISVGADKVRVDSHRIADFIADVGGRGLPHNVGREVLRQRLAQEFHDQYLTQQREAGRPAVATESTIRRLSSFANALDRMWPSWSPEDFLRTLYGTQAWLVEAAEGALAPADRASLYRAPQASIADEPWTLEDLFCLDEMSTLLNGEVLSYGHIVVDEAQDLTPMQARALARRCPSGSFTLLGDLAQATGHWIRDDWSELTATIAAPTTRIEQLTIGYRVPASALSLAARLLPLISPNLVAPTSIRPGLRAPQVWTVTEGEILDAVATRARELVELGLTTAIIVEDGDYLSALEALTRSGDAVGDGRHGDFSSATTLVPASLSKGLEFDAVVVVEPADIVAGTPSGRRLLYIAMTRCTQELHLVHQSDLPDGLDHLAPRRIPVEAAEAVVAADDLQPSQPDFADLADQIRSLTEADRELVIQMIARMKPAAPSKD